MAIHVVRKDGEHTATSKKKGEKLIRKIHLMLEEETDWIGETLDSVTTVFNEIAQHPPHTLFAVCNWSIGHPR